MDFIMSVNWEWVIEGIARGVCFLIVTAIMFTAFLGGQSEYIEQEETLESYNQKFAATAEDWEMYAHELKKEWSEADKAFYILYIKKLMHLTENSNEMACIDFDEKERFERLTKGESKRKRNPKWQRPEPKHRYNSEKKSLNQMQVEVVKKEKKEALRPRKNGDDKIYLKKVDKQSFEL